MKFLGVIAFCLLICEGKAQIRGVFSIGYIGNSDSSNIIFSTPVILDGGYCYRLVTGGASFQIPVDGVFKNICIVDSIVDRPELHFGIYPNPFKKFITIRMLTTLTNAEKVLVGVYAINGMHIKTDKISSAELSIGYRMNLATLKAGTYVLTLSSQSLSMAYKIIKCE